MFVIVWFSIKNKKKIKYQQSAIYKYIKIIQVFIIILNKLLKTIFIGNIYYNKKQ